MKKTLVKSILLAIFGMMVVQNVNAQKISAGEEVATNIGPGLGANDYFYYDNILYQVVTPVANDNYEAKAVAFFGESLPAEIEILGGGQANSCTFTVTEIEALNSVKAMSGTSYVEGDASALSAITTIIFVKEDGFNGFAGTIKAGAFANLSGLQFVYTYLNTPPTAEAGSFARALATKARLTVPVDENSSKVWGTTAGKYANATGWSDFTKIYTDGDEKAFGNFDMDNTIIPADASALLKFINNRFSSSSPYNANSQDVDGNGVRQPADASALLKMINARKRAQ